MRLITIIVSGWVAALGTHFSDFLAPVARTGCGTKHIEKQANKYLVKMPSGNLDLGSAQSDV
jgi:hypothetical protein